MCQPELLLGSLYLLPFLLLLLLFPHPLHPRRHVVHRLVFSQPFDLVEFFVQFSFLLHQPDLLPNLLLLLLLAHVHSGLVYEILLLTFTSILPIFGYFQRSQPQRCSHLVSGLNAHTFLESTLFAVIFILGNFIVVIHLRLRLADFLLFLLWLLCFHLNFLLNNFHWRQFLLFVLVLPSFTVH